VALVLVVVVGVEFVALVLLGSLLLRSRRQVGDLRQQLERSARAAPRSPAALAMRAVAETAARVRDRGIIGGLLMSSLDDLSRWITDDRTAITRVAAPDGTVTIFFSDIEDSTAWNEQLGDARWVRLLAAHDAQVRRCVEKCHGHVVKSQGDGFMVVFGDPSAAARADVEIQDVFTDRPVRKLRQTPLRLRIGMHIGEVVARDGDYFGRNVAVAARVAAEARGAEILVSDEFRAALSEHDGFTFAPRGEVELKGLADRHTLWELGVG
jgi:class 3 adenylate cyclase